ncbi:hypothetical protein B0H14DRAFT_2999187 [Mycena olivaceomarginata]|nr:hypothetical protein B0H14DRAFT_2999187 [Mycena olivaceomarginata]
MWRFIRRQKTWTSLSDLTWETAFGGDVRAALAGDTSEDHVAACLRLVSSLASTAMTALYALEQLYDHAEWNTRASLTIHVLGSRAEFDPAVVYMYETMLHRIPSLTNLHIIFCDNLASATRHVIRDVVICLDCQKRSASIVHEYVGKNYVDHVRSEGPAFQSPDLCILMSGYIANNETTLWSQTIQILLERGIPALFTANEHLYARRDLGMLRGVRNPWGSLLMQLNLDKLHGFCAANQWLAGAFAKKDD